MKSLRHLGIVILLLVSYLTPAMACMVSDVQMNAEERACCHAMNNQCGRMEMPASHGCCQKAPKSAQDNALDTKAVIGHPIAVNITWLPAAESLNLRLVTMGPLEPADHSPPQAPPSSSSVLRI